MTALTLDVPDGQIALLGSPEASIAKEALVLDLLREARIGQGKAADVLGLTRWEMLDLMAQHHILSGPETAEEVHQEVEGFRRLMQDS